MVEGYSGRKQKIMFALGNLASNTSQKPPIGQTRRQSCSENMGKDALESWRGAVLINVESRAERSRLQWGRVDCAYG